MYGRRKFLTDDASADAYSLIGRSHFPKDLPVSQTDNPFWDIVRTIPGNTIEWQFRHRWQPDWTATHFTEHPIERDDLCKQYAWAIPDPLSLAFVTEHIGTCAIELGAGVGYWSYQLSQLGVDMLAYDIAPPQLVTDNYWHSPMRQKAEVRDSLGQIVTIYESSSEFAGETRPVFFDVLQGGPEVLPVHSNRTLFLCWPPMSDMAALCLQAYTGKRLVYIGEDSGGCTADDTFFEMLAGDWTLVASYTPIQWAYIHDEIMVYERNQKIEETQAR